MLRFFFPDFWSHNGKKTASFSVQTGKIIFKQTNHKPPRHYRPLTPTTGSNTDATANLAPT
jgi:hypothetical protein